MMERIQGKLWKRIALLEAPCFDFDALRSAVERASTMAHPEVVIQEGYDWQHELRVSACVEPSDEEARLFETHERSLAEKKKRRELETLKELKAKYGDAEVKS